MASIISVLGTTVLAFKAQRITTKPWESKLLDWDADVVKGGEYQNSLAVLVCYRK